MVPDIHIWKNLKWIASQTGYNPGLCYKGTAGLTKSRTGRVVSGPAQIDEPITKFHVVPRQRHVTYPKLF